MPIAQHTTSSLLGPRQVVQTRPDPESYIWENWQSVHSNFEIYSPAYLSAGPRPEIVACSDVVQYGQQVDVTVAIPGTSTPTASIGSVSLISPGSVTHHFDWDQRHVKLAFQPSPQSSATKIRAVLPANPFIAPPGYYMLFVTTLPTPGGERIPSVAKFIKIQ
jgi:hypothetical protein